MLVLYYNTFVHKLPVTRYKFEHYTKLVVSGETLLVVVHKGRHTRIRVVSFFP